MQRRAFLSSVFAAGVTPRFAIASGSVESFEEIAKALASRPYRDPSMQLAPPFDTLTYDSFRSIRPAPGGAGGIALGHGVHADLLPPGFYFQDAVAIDIMDGDTVRSIPFDPNLFSYGERYFSAPPALTEAEKANMGFSGLRLRAPFRQSGTADEFFVVQGASYFRVVSRDTLYGLSARALAIGTGGGAPEEFPVFTRLRLHQADADAIRLEALIESPSVTGAARLTIHPGEPTVTHVDLVLFPRVTLQTVGIAPLTSMYLKGPLRASVSDDFRPRVHDSDALRVLNGAGEMLWRPLSNPTTLQTSGFEDSNPRGFGLVQSARAFSDFEDPEAAYHKRPNAWVTPQEPWGRGRVMLVEIPTADEFFDNIVAFWRPEEPLEAGGVYRYAYRIETGADPVFPDAAQVRVAQSRSGRVHDRPGQLQYIVDFAADDPAGLIPEVMASTGDVVGLSAYVLGERGHLRVGFRFEPGEAMASELRLVLRNPAGEVKSDVWLHRWTPARDGGV